MKTICLLLIATILSTASAASADLIYSEDFEDNDAADTYGTRYEDYWSTFNGATEIVTTNPYGGSYSLRGSISEIDTLDNITLEPGVPNIHGNIGVGETNYGSTANFDLETEIDSGELYISWWHLWDDGELANLLGDTHKIMYLYTNYPIDYIILRIGDSRRLRLIVNADGERGWPYTAGDDSSNGYQYGYDLGTHANIDDGEWHHFEFWIQYGTGGRSDSAIKFWLDDALLLDITDAVAIYQTGDEAEFFSMPSNISAAGTVVTSVGWQVDDIEIHDALPSSGSDSDTTNDNIGISGTTGGCFVDNLLL